MKGISRRRFLAASLAGGAATTLTMTKNALGSGTFEGYPEGMGVLVDLTRCVGCRSCEAACNKEQKLPAPDNPVRRPSVFDQTGHGGQKRRPDENAYTVVNRYEPKEAEQPVYRKVQCNHCNEPACLTSCFVNAYTKTKEGAVIYNSKICVGCRNCMIACPFNVPGYSYSSAFNPVVKKCIFCYDTRLKNGKPPACVEICPQEVLTFGHRKELIKIGRRIASSQARAVMSIISMAKTKSAAPAGCIFPACPSTRSGFDTTMGNEPIISNVKDFLGTVRWCWPSGRPSSPASICWPSARMSTTMTMIIARTSRKEGDKS